jgi:hypothetical protein
MGEIADDMIVYLGVDSGKKGGFVLISESGDILHQYVMPLTKGKTAKEKKIDCKQLCTILSAMTNLYTIVCTLEETASIFGVDKSTMFTMGRSLGIMEGVLSCGCVSLTMIRPKAWQKAAWESSDIVKMKSKSGKTVTDTKQTSANATMRLFPKADLRYGNNERHLDRRKKLHDGMVDAILIAYVCRLRHKAIDLLKNE